MKECRQYVIVAVIQSDPYVNQQSPFLQILLDKLYSNNYQQQAIQTQLMYSMYISLIQEGSNQEVPSHFTNNQHSTPSLLNHHQHPASSPSDHFHPIQLEEIDPFDYTQQPRIREMLDTIKLTLAKWRVYIQPIYYEPESNLDLNNSIQSPILPQQLIGLFLRKLQESIGSSRKYINERKVQAVMYNRQYGYLKKNLTRKQIQKYLFMQNAGIGVKILYYCFEKRLIVMEAGITLFDFISHNMNLSWIADNLYHQICRIQYILKCLNISHCDIKPQNMVLTYNSAGLHLLLIDFDQSCNFGQQRLVATPKINTVTTFELTQYEVCCSTTDEMGFLFVKNFLLSQICQ